MVKPKHLTLLIFLRKANSENIYHYDRELRILDENRSNFLS